MGNVEWEAMNTPSAVMALFAVLNTALAVEPEKQQQASIPEFLQIVEALDRANSQLAMIQVEGRTQEYERDGPASDWKATPGASTFSLTIENKPSGRYVLDLKPS